MEFTIGIKNLPTPYWRTNCSYGYYGEAAVLSPVLSANGSYTFTAKDIGTATYVNFRTMALATPTSTWDAPYKDTEGTTGYYGNMLMLKDGGSYIIDFTTGAISEKSVTPPTPPTPESGFSLEGLLPMSPLEGPPLPRFLGVYWPWHKG